LVLVPFKTPTKNFLQNSSKYVTDFLPEALPIGPLAFVKAVKKYETPLPHFPFESVRRIVGMKHGCSAGADWKRLIVDD
jgi:hypothetical protein